MSIEWFEGACAELNEQARKAAEDRQGQLTKPPGALGRLETVAIELAAMQGVEMPVVEKAFIAVFAADHGVAEEGISAFPQAVTAEMVKNFARGGAAISVLAKEHGAVLEVINLGTVVDTGELDNVKDYRLGASSANFVKEAAMTPEQFSRAMNAGRHAAERAKQAGAHIFIGGEMGIGNTTSAAALACALLDAKPGMLAGPGTGLDSAGVQHKVAVIQQGLDRHRESLGNAQEVLRCLGGFEIAGLVGAYLACAHMGLPVLVDGYISSVAALCAARIQPQSRPWFIFSHASAEPGHKHVMEALAATPLLDLGMRLGEGSGAAVALPLLRQACALHNHMATFAEAGVSGKSG